VLLRCFERRRKLRPAFQGISALAGFNFLEGLNEVKALGVREPRQRGLLRFQAKTGVIVGNSIRLVSAVESGDALG
jgi:hypothetical protein